MADNLDIGRSELIELIFRRGQRRGRPAAGQFKTKVFTYGTEVKVTISTGTPHQAVLERRVRTADRNRDQRPRRPELAAPPDASRRAADPRAVHTTLLDTEHAGQGCVLASPAFERVARPTLTEQGCMAPALRYPRVQALAGALATSVLATTGITNKSLRALMTRLLGCVNYTTNQASYDPTRPDCASNGLITSITGKNRYRLTSEG